jgi:glycosyltransferase involved in cell wall biosynthesis
VIGTDTYTQPAQVPARTRGMRVLHVIAPVSFGGGEAVLCNLLAERRPNLLESVALLYASAPFENALRASGIQHHRLQNRTLAHGVPAGRMLVRLPLDARLVRPLTEIVRAQRIDVLHVHGFPGSVLYSLMPGTPAVYTHHSLPAPAHGLRRAILTRCYRRFGVCTAVSRVAAERMVGIYGAPGVSFVPIHNCVSEQFFRARRAGRPRSTTRRVFVYVARFVSGKNHDLVLRALAGLEPSVRERLMVRMIGDGPTLARVQQLAADLQLNEVVEFLGSVPHNQLPGVLAEADYAIAASSSEGFGLAAAEALAVGLPVLAVDTPTMREVVGDGGILVPPHRFADGMARMLNDPPASEAARAAADRFRASAVKDAYAEQYNRLCQTTRW